MKVIKAFPPNWAEIAKVFPVKGKPGIIYAYGDRIYNPSGGKLPPWVVAHEEIHGMRQRNKWGTALWWDKYLMSPEFRLHEEVLAHRAEWQEYQHVMQAIGPADAYLNLIATRLSSPLYGSLVSFDEARKLIMEA